MRWNKGSPAKTRPAAADLVLLMLLMTASASAQDWPGWRGAGRDGKLSGFEAPPSWPKELQRGWQVEVGAGRASPALVGGRLYVFARQAEDEVTLCLNAVTGAEHWRDRYQAPYQPVCHHGQGKGPLSSPFVADGRVFTLGINAILSCLDAMTGRVVWRHDFSERFPVAKLHLGTAMSPLVVDGMCVVHVGGPDKGAILALDAASGKTRWSWEGDGPSYASPVIVEITGGRQLMTYTQSRVVGLAPADGRLLWQLEYKTSYDQNWVTPVVFGDILILSGLHRGTSAYGFEGREPKLAWHSDEVSMFMSTPILKGDRLFGFSEKRRGQFFCLDARNGKTLWRGEARQGENAAVLAAGDVILALTNRSELVVFEASDKAYSERARYKVADTPTWAHPVISGRAIFVKDEKVLTRWMIP